MKKNNLFYCLIAIIVLFISNGSVKAEQVVMYYNTENWGVPEITIYNYGQYGWNANMQHPLWDYRVWVKGLVVPGTTETLSKIAYCTDAGYNYYGYISKNHWNDGFTNTTYGNLWSEAQAANVNYHQDDTYANANVCSYIYNGVTYNNGDCSRIVGEIIGAVDYLIKNDSGFLYGTESQPNYFWTQLSIWAYLARFSYEPLISTNIKYNKAGKRAVDLYDYSTQIRDKVLPLAFKRYVENSKGQITQSKDINVQLSNYNTNFYYKPNSNYGCNNLSGFYRTSDMTLKNLEDRVVSVEIYTNNNDVQVCNGSSCAGTKKINLTKKGTNNSQYSFYLKTTEDKTRTIKLTVRVSYDDGTIEVYDSVRWITDYASAINPQGLVTAEYSKVDLRSEKKLEFNFKQYAISRRVCSDDYDNSDVAGGKSTNPVSKVCATNSSGSKNTGEYTATFTGCTCMTLELSNKRFVNILVYENVGFRYGKLTSDSGIFPGGGFSFVNSSSGISTQYLSKITWDYANYMNGKPYYYNQSNPFNWDATSLTSAINSALESKINNSIDITFKTIDSNNYKNKKNYKLNFTIEKKSFNSSTNVFEFRNASDEGINLNKAYFSVGGLVQYGSKNSTYSIDGGNKYYIPLNYEDATFPFDIIEPVNLSIVDGIEFWYKASCSIPVLDETDSSSYCEDGDCSDFNNGYGNLRYRSISLEDPFPKSDNNRSEIPVNWREWYCGAGTGSVCSGNNTNINRLKNTYQNLMYQVVLDSTKIKNISKENYSYFEWNNVNKNGSDSFVTKYFDKVATNNYYCQIGEFKTSCDKY